MYQNDRVIERCCSLSENIDNFFSEERYLAEVNQIEEVTPEFLRNIAITQLLGELEVLGIITNQDAGEVLTDSVALETAFYLRAKFDSYSYYKALTALPEEVYATYMGIVENIEFEEDILIELGNFFNNVFPTDVGWDYISRANTQWTSTLRLSEHITAIQIKVDTKHDNNTTPITEDNFENIKLFLQHTCDREKQIRIYVDKVASRFKVDIPALYDLVSKYDHEKLQPDLLEQFAWYYVNESKTEPPSHVLHHLTVNHHHEYWEYRHNTAVHNNTTSDEQLNETTAVMVVGSMVLDGMTQDKMRADIDKYFKPLTTVVTPMVLAFMYELTTIAIT